MIGITIKGKEERLYDNIQLVGDTPVVNVIAKIRAQVPELSPTSSEDGNQDASRQFLLFEGARPKDGVPARWLDSDLSLVDNQVGPGTVLSVRNKICIITLTNHFQRERLVVDVEAPLRPIVKFVAKRFRMAAPSIALFVDGNRVDVNRPIASQSIDTASKFIVVEEKL